MPHLIKKFESYAKKAAATLRDNFDYKITDYIRDDSNFPELENIKTILQDINDWCFMHGENKPFIEKWIVRTNTNKYDDYDYEVNSIQGDRISYPDIVENMVYYKSFRVLFQLSKKDLNDLNDLVESACKRIENYGFNIKKYTYSTDATDDEVMYTIFIISKTDSITLNEILY